MHEPPRVLIVEDDAQIVQALRLRLNHAGDEVLAAESAELGLEIAAKSLPDVIVMDIQLPNMDGLTALCEIHSKPATRHTPVLILSACAKERNHALELGAYQFLDKPYNSKHLIAAIQDALKAPDRSKLSALAMDQAPSAI